jgi:hypothetical protein
MGRVEERMTKLEDAMTELARTVNRTSETVDRTSQTVERTEATVERTSQTVERALTRMSQTVERTEATVERTIVESRRAWGEMANKMGTLVEDIVAPGIPTIFRDQFGITELEMSTLRLRRAHRLDRGRTREFDYVVMAGDVVLVNETKSHLRPDDIPAFVVALQDIRNYLPEAEGRKVIGCLASFSLDPSLVIAGERQGLLMVGLATGLLRVLNSSGFEPRKF